MENNELEELIFAYLDKFKILITPETWGNVLLDCSRNELFLLLLVYRKGEANMSQIAEYIKVPLNTATGIVDRMEKKKLIQRNRSQEDKRVVTVRITEDGASYIASLIKEALYYAQTFLETLSAEEIQLLLRIIDRLIFILEEHAMEKEQKPAAERKVKRIIIE